MTANRLKTKNVTAYIDDDTHYVLITYEGSLQPSTTAQLYQWLEDTLPQVGAETVRGCIFDFRKVSSFPTLNLPTAHKESFRVNSTIDMSHIPTALVYETPYQERQLRASLEVTPQQQRKKVVNSIEDALAFIEEWNRNRGVSDNS